MAEPKSGNLPEGHARRSTDRCGQVVRPRWRGHLAADGTDCDEDLGGDGCPGKLDTSLWTAASVDSATTFHLDHQVLDNASNENGTDVADITMNVELSW